MKLDYIKAGKISAPHGIRGEVHIQPRDGDPAFLTRFRTFYTAPAGPALRILRSQVHKNILLAAIDGCQDRNAAEALCGRELYFRREDANQPEDRPFDDELLDMEVFSEEDGSLLGRIAAVETYPASKVYTVRGEKEYLVPAVPGAFIRSVDLLNNRMEIHVWEGLATDEH